MSDDAQNASGEPNDAEGTNDTSNDAQNVSGDAGTTNDASSSTSQGDDVVTRAEFESIKARMQAADRAKATVENELKELRRKDQSELERAQTDVKDLTGTVETLKKRLNDTLMENVFLSNNKYTWHDPQDALRLMDMEGVSIDDDGKVSGLPEAIAKLAKAKPHLLKTEGSNDAGTPSGSAANGKRKGEGKPPKKEYSSRFPALRNS